MNMDGRRHIQVRNGAKLLKIDRYRLARPPMPYVKPNIPRGIDDCSPSVKSFLLNKARVPMHFLFEFASGYALFEALGVDKVDMFNFELSEKYINSSHQIFKLEAFLPFSSPEDALVQMNSISNSTVTEELKTFLQKKLPESMTIDGIPNYFLAVSDALLAYDIGIKARISNTSGLLISNVMRGLRMKIDNLIKGLEPEDLKKARLNLARQYSKQRCSRACIMAVSSSSVLKVQKVVVVPHILEGVFIAKGNEDLICTKNLVPGETLYGEELLYVQNEDGTEVEYRVWDPLRSKLAVAIMCGVTNIWVKPGSHVLCLGDECGITVSHLSDLVGLDGLVYAVGLSDDVVKMAEKRSNVVPIFENCEHRKYRMLLGMVDVIFADIIHPDQVNYIATNAVSYLKAGGHYVISTPASKDPLLDHHRRRGFKPIELVTLEPRERAHAMAVGVFRMLVE